MKHEALTPGALSATGIGLWATLLITLAAGKLFITLFFVIEEQLFLIETDHAQHIGGHPHQQQDHADHEEEAADTSRPGMCPLPIYSRNLSLHETNRDSLRQRLPIHFLKHFVKGRQLYSVDSLIMVVCSILLSNHVSSGAAIFFT